MSPSAPLTKNVHRKLHQIYERKKIEWKIEWKIIESLNTAHGMYFIVKPEARK
jgi:hypothetical protein